MDHPARSSKYISHIVSAHLISRSPGSSWFKPLCNATLFTSTYAYGILKISLPSNILQDTPLLVLYLATRAQLYITSLDSVLLHIYIEYYDRARVRARSFPLSFSCPIRFPSSLLKAHEHVLENCFFSLIKKKVLSYRLFHLLIGIHLALTRFASQCR